MAEGVDDEGFEWAGSFVKRGLCDGHPIAFRISPQLVVNLLPVSPGAGPAEILVANDAFIKAACRQALRRASWGTHTLDVTHQDFDAVEREAG